MNQSTLQEGGKNIKPIGKKKSELKIKLFISKFIDLGEDASDL